MLNLDPAKLLVIAVVTIILLGPDKLPQVARQVGGAWRSFNEFRHRMETEVRSSMPDLPSTTEIARLARSPSALLDHLSNMGADETDDDDEDAAAAVGGPDAVDGQAPALGEGETTDAVAGDVVVDDAPPSMNGNGNGSVPPEVDAVETTPHNDTTATASSTPAAPPDVTPEQRSQNVIVPGDPNLN